MDFDNAFFERERTYLMKMTLMQIHQKEQAEEIVQDTLLAAFEAQARYSGTSSPRTWLTGILKHKITDFLRSKYRANVVSLDDDTHFDRGLYEGLFEEGGHWRADGAPDHWPSAEQALQDQQFWRVFESCMQAMPERTAAVFVQRELMGEEIDELCKMFSITATNVSVTLYRARMILRECLEEKWLK